MVKLCPEISDTHLQILLPNLLIFLKCWRHCHEYTATVVTAVVPDELEGANLTQGTARISPGSRVTTEYLHYFLTSKNAKIGLADKRR